MATEATAGVSFRRVPPVTRSEVKSALRMVRQRAWQNMKTAPATLGASLNWRPTLAERVTVKAINDGLLEDINGYLLLTPRGIRALQ